MFSGSTLFSREPFRLLFGRLRCHSLWNSQCFRLGRMVFHLFLISMKLIMNFFRRWFWQHTALWAVAQIWAVRGGKAVVAVFFYAFGRKPYHAYPAPHTHTFEMCLTSCNGSQQLICWICCLFSLSQSRRLHNSACASTKPGRTSLLLHHFGEFFSCRQKHCTSHFFLEHPQHRSCFIIYIYIYM